MGGALKLRSAKKRALVDTKQPLGVLPTPSFWLDREILRLALPVRAVGASIIVSSMLALAFSGLIGLPWWTFVVLGMTLGLLALGLFERHIRRRALERRERRETMSFTPPEVK